MKVLQINAVYGQGSTGTIVRDIEQLCEQNGIKCYVASPDSKVREAKRGYVIGNALDHKLHALLCRINGMQGYFSHIPTWNLCRYIDRIKPDVVHLHNLHSNYIHLNILLNHLAKRDIKTVVTLHDCWFYTGGCFHYTFAACDRWKKGCGHCPKKKQDTPALLFDKSDKILEDRKKYFQAIRNLIVVGVSDWIRLESVKTIFANRPNLTIYNGIDFQIFKPTPSNLRQRLNLEDKYVIMGPASKWLAPINRPILNYFSENMQNDECLLLFGCGQNTPDLSSNVIKYGYTKDRHELAQLYTMADIFVNCTREESLSLINVEAQACGTPVITFDNTGVAETVNGIYGVRVPTGDVRKLYNAIKKIRKSKSDFDDILINVRMRFDLQKNYKRYIELYNQGNK